MLKAKDFREQSDDDLLLGLEERQKEIFALRSQNLEAKSQKTHEISQKRKEIARILTIQNERKNK